MLQWQDKVVEPKGKMSRKEILEKLEKIEEESCYVMRCLNVRICPGCGRNIPNSEHIDAFFTCDCGFSRINISCINI